MIYNVAATIISFPAGGLSDKLGPRGPLLVTAAGVAAFLVSYVLFATSGPLVLVLGVAFALAGVGIVCAETAEHAARGAQDHAHQAGGRDRAPNRNPDRHLPSQQRQHRFRPAAGLDHAPGPRMVVSIEGTGSYGVGLDRAAAAAGLIVVECERPNRKARRGKGKSDTIDAHLAVVSALRVRRLDGVGRLAGGVTPAEGQQ